MARLSGQNVFMVDLHHPGGENEEINLLFSEIPGDTFRLFLMGDIFHYWINDTSFIEQHYSSFLNKLKNLASQGIQVFFIEGNRDFLASHYLDDQPWIDVLGNPTVIELGGRAVYLGHGDELCWNDWAYQLYKSIIRSQPLRYLADRLPSSLRMKTVQRMSSVSPRLVAKKSRETLAVPEQAYQQVIASGVDVIIHGHLHQTYQRAVFCDNRKGEIFSFGWKDGKRNIIHFEG
ncbi:MAG: UDP-2,3-diacylglucosamine diphosphatase [bacterium]|jgi:UDP-2,3-diacylglucosamine hydrolase